MFGLPPDGQPLATPTRLTRHARLRMTARRISPGDVTLALRYGRRARVGAGTMYVVGRREIARPEGPPELRRLDGLHVLVTPDDGTVITTYRNRRLRGLRAARRRRRRRFRTHRTLRRGRRR